MENDKKIFWNFKHEKDKINTELIIYIRASIQ